MASIDKQFSNLLRNIKKNGTNKNDRTGTGTRSLFGTMIKHDMRVGFPLLTIKETWMKGIATELLWFLAGATNIKYLVEI